MSEIGHGKKEIKERLIPEKLVRSRIKSLKSIEISGRCARECINIAYGFFTPLKGFMGREDIESVCENMTLKSGVLWPIPIVLDVDGDELKAKNIKAGENIILKYTGKPLAVLEVEEIFRFDRMKMAEAVLGTTDEKHPGVVMLKGLKETFIRGNVSLINPPQFQPPFDRFWYTPRKLRQEIEKMGWKRVVAHQTRNVPHGGHEWLMKGAWFSTNGELPVEKLQTGILVSCIIGPKRIGDYIDEAILLGHNQLRESGYFRKEIHLVSIALWDMRYAGPREAVFHAILRTNLGCTHHMFGRDHAGVGSYYDPYDAHRIFDRFSEEMLSIKPVRILEWWYCPVCGEVTYSGLCGHEKEKQKFSGTLIRSMLQDRVKPTKLILRPEVYEQVMECSRRYGFGSPFCTERYLSERVPVFTLSPLDDETD